MTNSGGIWLLSIAVLASVLMCGCRNARAGRSTTLGVVPETDRLRQLVIDQPDFTAEENERYSEEHRVKEVRGINSSYSVAKRGSTYRQDRAVVIIYSRPDQPALLFYPRSREYLETPRLGPWFENAASPGLLATEEGPKLVFESLGDEQVDGHRCLKIQVSMPDEAAKSSAPTRVVYYLASDLRNLVIRTDLIDFLGTMIYTLKNISFDVPEELLRLPSGYIRAAADPTAEYRLLDHFQLAELGRVEPESFRKALLEKLPPGTPEEEIYRYLDERLVGKDRFSSYQRADQHSQTACRIEYDPTLPGPVKKHFAVIFLLDENKKLRDVRLNSWITGL